MPANQQSVALMYVITDPSKKHRLKRCDDINVLNDYFANFHFVPSFPHTTPTLQRDKDGWKSAKQLF